MFLVAGLGNPGDKYKNNRHNIGFLVIDEITKKLSTTNINKSNFKAQVLKSQDLLYAKPQTYMNESGQAISAISQYYNIPLENIIVIHDDLDLPFGTVKFKQGGGHGGHNGLRSIDAHIGKEYIRVRVGIGKPTDKNEVINHVLNDFSKDEFKALDEIIPHIVNSLEKFENHTFEKFKSKYTLKSKS